MSPEQAPDVVIGTVVAPHGIRGEVKVRMETDFPERFEELEEVWLQPKSGPGRMAGIEGVRFHQNVVLIKFEGCDDRNAAEELRDADLRISKEDLVELEAGQFYIHDIIGLDVYTTEGRHLGQVTEVLQGPANDVYVTPMAMIPALKQFVREIDLEERKMIVEPVEGLTENEE